MKAAEKIPDANGAITLLSMKYLRDRGHKEMHFGGSRAFMNDGALQFKKHRGITIEDSTRHGFLITYDVFSKTILRFLSRNPFIHVDRDGYAAALFLDHSQFQHLSGRDIECLLRRYSFKGVKKLMLRVFEEDKIRCEFISHL